MRVCVGERAKKGEVDKHRMARMLQVLLTTTTTTTLLLTLHGPLQVGDGLLWLALVHQPPLHLCPGFGHVTVVDGAALVSRPVVIDVNEPVAEGEGVIASDSVPIARPFIMADVGCDPPLIFVQLS